MRHCHFVCVLVFGVVLFAARASANERSGFLFLRLAFGARTAALAEAVTASAGDITAANYNPAALMAIGAKSQVLFSHQSYFQDASQEFIGLATRNKRQGFGLFLASGKVPGFERRGDAPTAEPLGEFEENNFWGSLLYARCFGRLDIGGAIKYAFERLDYASAYALAVDLGLAFCITDHLTAATAVRHLGAKPRFENKHFPLPREYRLGLGYHRSAWGRALELSVDAVFGEDCGPKFNLGMDCQLVDGLFGRLGYGVGYDSRGISMGGGLRFGRFGFDYALVNYLNDLGDAHRFSAAVSF